MNESSLDFATVHQLYAKRFRSSYQGLVVNDLIFCINNQSKAAIVLLTVQAKQQLCDAKRVVETVSVEDGKRYYILELAKPFALDIGFEFDWNSYYFSNSLLTKTCGTKDSVKRDFYLRLCDLFFQQHLNPFNEFAIRELGI